MPTVLKSGSLSLLEPSGPVQACNGIALSFLPDTLFGKVTALLILGSVLPYASFSALVLNSGNEPHTDKHPLNNLARLVRLQYT